MPASTLHRILSPLLLTAAFVCTLFFNGSALTWFAAAMVCLILWVLHCGVLFYQQNMRITSGVLSISVLLFWLWLGLDVVFSQVIYLGILNFWWVGVLPLVYLGYILHPHADALWQRVYPMLVVTGMALSAMALYQYFFVNGFPSATFFNKNSLAALLNLLLFPLMGYYLLAEKKKPNHGVLVPVFIFVFVLGVIQSRGAGLASLFALLLIAMLGYGYFAWRRVIPLMATLGLALVAANLAAVLNPLAGGADLFQRAASLMDTGEAGLTRFVIWGPAWELFLQHPLTGVGLGSYFLAIPPTLHPLDTSANYYVHNDYLQLAVETGVPGVLLFCGMMLMVVWQFVRAWRKPQQEVMQRPQLLFIFAALCTVAIHSVFTFNLYLMPTMLVTGLLLGRFNQLCQMPVAAAEEDKLLRDYLGAPIFYLLLGVVGIFLLNSFVNVGLGSYFQQRGKQLAGMAQLEQAHNAYLKAQRYTPLFDTVFTSDADLLRRSALLVQDRPPLAQSLQQEAQRNLARASWLNPLRPQSQYVQAKLYEQTLPDRPLPVVAAYANALKLDPRYLPARVALARYLIKLDDSEMAMQILREGMAFRYRGLSPTFMDYVSLSIEVARQQGEMKLASDLEVRLQSYRRQVRSAGPQPEGGDAD